MTNIEWLDFEEDQSLDLSFPSTFSVVLTAEISECLKNNLNELGEMWRLIGLPQNKRDEQIEEIRESLISHVDKFVQNGKEFLQECRNFREYKLKEVNKILADLSLPPYTLSEEAQTLITQCKLLQKKYKELLEIKNEQMRKLESIENKLKKICHLLAVNYEPTIFATNIPSEMELKSLALILKNHEKTLVDRKLQYDSLKSHINKLQFDLEYSLENEDEKLIALGKDEFIFSQSNMTKLSDLHKKLVQKYNCYKVRIEKLIETLQQLYNRLDVPQQERDLFLNSLVGTFPQQEQRLEDEMAKYEIIKKNSIEKIIKNIRNEITILFHKCMVSRFNESLMDSENYTEELLIKLEFEYEKLKKFSDLYEIVFQKFFEFEDSLERLVELEKKSMDPNRFTNRGGALLQNERDKKMLQKKLPRIEKEIRNSITTIENANNLPFNTYGLNIDIYFESNWKHLNDCKSCKTSSLKKLTNIGSSSTKTGISSAQKNRIPFSPRSNNQKTTDNSNEQQRSNGLLRGNLDSEMKKAFDPIEQKFQMGIQKESLHSTMIDVENKIPYMDLHTPSPFTGRVTYRRNRDLRRRSKSCEHSNRPRFRINKVEISSGTSSSSSSSNRPNVETIIKRPPFIP